MVKPIIITHPTCVKHETGHGHLERPERLTSILEMLDRDLPDLQVLKATLGTDEQIRLAHPQIYLDDVITSIPKSGIAQLEGDTFVGPKSLDAARYAVGGACQAVDLVMADQARSVFVATRPPGHHAEPERAMGFCIFANAYIAARWAQEKYDAKNVAIVDFDVHHGNGTAAMIYADMRPDVYFISTHQHPLYPGTGNPDIDDDANGRIIDIPLPAGTTGEMFRAVYAGTVIPALENIKPDLLILSAGFDAHKKDPIGGMRLNDQDFFDITRMLMATCPKIVSVLEGGYDLDALASATRAHLQALGA